MTGNKIVFLAPGVCALDSKKIIMRGYTFRADVKETPWSVKTMALIVAQVNYSKEAARSARPAGLPIFDDAIRNAHAGLQIFTVTV